MSQPHLVHEWQVHRGRLFIGLTWLPYQVASGWTLRGGEFTGIRLYFGPLKLWASWLTKEPS
jgi:hypothetical protein